MRWNEPESGDEKIKRKFALFPITIDGETRWLEWVTIKYRFSKYDIHVDPITHRAYRSYGWDKYEFIDEQN